MNLELGRVAQVLSHIEAVLPYLEHESLMDALEPIWVDLRCYQVLAAAADPRSTAVLLRAHSLVQQQAARTSRRRAPALFLRISAHNAICAAYHNLEKCQDAILEFGDQHSEQYVVMASAQLNVRRLA
ncbi:MAG: hypothetical protein HC822_14070 [Oscillochloris sp.]|nr:hypothetical protein [Oscillochloris sp.]